MALTDYGLEALTRRVRRWSRVGSALRWGLLTAAVIALTGGLLLQRWAGLLNLALLAVVAAWMLLSMLGVRATRMLMVAGARLQAGQPAQAEQALVLAATGFSLQSQTRLLAAHNLASLAHSQGRFDQAAVLCKTVLAELRSDRSQLARRSRLLLVDSQVLLGDLHGAYGQMAFFDRTELSFSEQLTLLPIRCMYDVLTGAWRPLAEAARARERLSEMVPAPQAALTLACAALGCQQVGLIDRRDWLWRKATLLAEPERLMRRFPPLKALADAPAARPPWPEDEQETAEPRPPNDSREAPGPESGDA